MTDDSRRDRATGNDGTRDDQRDRSTMGREPGREASPLGTEPQEPRSTHMGHSGRQDPDAGRDPDAEDDPQRGVVEQLKKAWDRKRGK